MGQSVLIHDLPAQERPREKLAALGADALSSHELIAILLRTGTKGASALHISEQLLARFQTLENLARAPLEELRKTKGVGRDKAIALKAAFTLALRMAREIRNEAPLLDTPEVVGQAGDRLVGEDVIDAEGSVRVRTGAGDTQGVGREKDFRCHMRGIFLRRSFQHGRRFEETPDRSNFAYYTKRPHTCFIGLFQPGV